MTRHRAVAVVASARACCSVCEGEGEVRVRAVPVGAWVTTKCPHSAEALPIIVSLGRRRRAVR